MAELVVRQCRPRSWSSARPPPPSCRPGAPGSSRARSTCRPHRRPACGRRGSRPASRSSARRTRCRRRRDRRCWRRAPPTASARPARDRRHRPCRRSGLLPVSPNSGLTPVKLMWSEIAISAPGGMSSRRLPAALVCSSVSQPSAAMARIARLHLVGAATLVIVRAALQHGDGRRADMAQHEPAGVAADRRSAGKPGSSP